MIVDRVDANLLLSGLKLRSRGSGGWEDAYASLFEALDPIYHPNS